MPRFTLIPLFSCLSVMAATLHVDPKGNDDGNGSDAQPLRSIQRAADLAQPGDTILVGPGLYRERIAPPRSGKQDAPITFRSAVRHAAVVRGSSPWSPKWRNIAPNIFSGKVEEAMFTDTSHRDGANPFLIPSSSTPYGRDGKPEFERQYPKSDPKLSFNLGQVFVDDECYIQEPDEAKMKSLPKSWRYEDGELTIHFPDNRPTNHKVELTTQRRLFAPHVRQLSFIRVEGFVFERCGNQYPTNFWLNEKPEWQQAGMVGTRSGRNWIIRDNIIRFANGIGLDLGNEGAATADLETGDNGPASGAKGHLVEGNIVCDNGGGGTASYNATHLVIRRNVFERNNRLLFNGPKRWESAGLKLHHPSNSIIDGNLIRDNYVKWGIWFDGGAGKETRITNNVCMRQGVGIDFEIGNAEGAVVEGNLLIENEIGIRTRESGGVDIRRNLILGSKIAGIQFSLDRKRGGNWNAARCGIYQNLIMGDAGLFLMLTAPDQLRSEDRKLDGNIYATETSGARFAFETNKPMAFAAWQKAWQGFNGATDSEGKSRLVNGCTYQFDPTKMELYVTLSFNPKDETYPGLKLGKQKVDLGFK